MAHIRRRPLQPSVTLEVRARRLYFTWLCQLVYIDNWCGNSYYDLAYILHNIDFYTLVPLDENREKDGVRLRETWLGSLRDEAEALGIGEPMIPPNALGGPCTVLEMLVALSVRLEADIMQDDSIGPRTQLWFWSMMQNIGLAEYHDNTTIEYEDVLDRVYTVLDRKHNPDGSGGLFPLKHAVDNQMFVDIWWQAQLWLRENYGA